MIRQAAFAYSLPLPHKLCLSSSCTFIWFNNFAGKSGKFEKKKKTFPGEFFFSKLEAFWWYRPLKPEKSQNFFCFKNKIALALGLWSVGNVVAYEGIVLGERRWILESIWGFRLNFNWHLYCKDQTCLTGPWMQTKIPQAMKTHSWELVCRSFKCNSALSSVEF